MPKRMVLTALENFPLVQPGDDLPELIIKSLADSDIQLEENDIAVIAQKIISKAEDRFVHLSSISPSKRAYELSKLTGKDPRFLELVLRESDEILRVRMGTIIVQHKLGFICANAGIDHSNVALGGKQDDDLVLLLPKNPDNSAEQIRESMTRKTKKNIGVVVIDSHGRAWRKGIVGTTIGIAGVPAIIDLRGVPDMFGYHLRITQIAAVDELAAGASLLMGQASEKTPVIHVRGFPYSSRISCLNELIRPEDEDLFR